MKSVTFLAFSFILTFFSLIKWVDNISKTGYSPESGYYTSGSDTPIGIKLVPESACDSVTLFVQQLRTFPPSCCFSLIVDNKLQNAITQIKLDITTATFTNIVVEINQGWIVSQTPQMDILLSHNSGFIPVGGASPLSFCLKGGNNPDSLKISYNYSALGTSGTCLVNTVVCSDPAPCDAAFNFQPIGSCGNFQFANQSTGTPPLTYSWNFGDPGSGAGNTSTSQNPSHQFSKCGDFIVCLKTTALRCVDSICKTIAYFDQVKPVITCPANLLLRCNSNTSPAATGTATATDNCTSTNAIAITFSDVVTGTMPCNGLITRTWQAKDACNNISTCIQTISIQDNIPPTITCPANTTVTTNPGVCFYTGNIPQAIATDNCDPSLTFIYSLLTSGSSILISSQTQFPKGINTITVFARDDCGNQSANCNFTLTVVDNTPPIIMCPGNVTVSGAFDSLGNCKAVVQNIAPVATDNCPMLTVSYTLSGATNGQGIADASGISFTAGMTVVTYIVSDMSGNKDTCSFSISVSCPDNWSCPCQNGAIAGPNLVVNGNFSAGNTGFTNDFIYINPGGTTNNGNYSVLTNTQVPVANAQWNCNDHTTGTGSFLVIDGASSTGNNTAWKQTIIGNDGGTFNFCFFANNLVIPLKNFMLPDIGIYFNGILAKPSVILPESPDAWVPFNATWSGILPVTVEIRTLSFQVVGNDFALDDIKFVKCSDSLPCEPAFTFQSINTCGNFQFSNQSIGLPPIAYTWNFGDPGSGSSNTSTAQNPAHQFSKCGDFIVCLQMTSPGCMDSICKTISYFDLINPVISCPSNLILGCNSNTSPTVTGVATATDNCTPANAIIITFSDVVTGIMPCNGLITRTWQARDSCNNISTCMQTISIQDTIAPTITCPANAVVTTNPGACFYTGNIPQATGLDNCDQNLDYTYSLLTAGSSILINPQTQFPKGINTITCFAKDDCGNQSQNCNFTLTVVDNQPPSITCPNSMTVIGTLNAQGQCKSVVNNLAPVVTDNCPMVTTTYTISGATIGAGNTDASGTSFMPGLSTVAYTATDMGGNISTCSFTITVNCPRPKCDSVSASLTPRFFPASPFACLFDLNISNQAISISQIRITLKTAAFGGAAINSPFIGNFFPPNLLILSHASGSIPLGNFLAAGITINSGTNPDTALVEFFYNNGQSSCDTNIVFNCPVPPPPKPKCDSVSAFLIPFQAIPYACTYQFHVNNQASAISKIQIDLKTATFNSAGIVSPFSPVISPASRLIITHPSGIIPLGNFHTADLGINIGSNPDTAIIKFFYNNGQSTCDTNIIFNCPVDTTCGYAPSCATTSISLNTGIGSNGQLLAPGSFDPNWTIIQTPYTGLILPRPAEVVTPYISWDMQPNAATPCAQWISAFQGADKGSGPRYTYSKCFCVCTDSSNIQIKLSAMADNEADFWLYDGSGNFITTLLGIHPPGLTPSHAFILPPDTSTTQLVLKKGTYCIRAGVKNWTRVTGINVCGSITGPGLIKADCCEINSYITGIKYKDTLCNGLPYSGQPKLSGWQIILCDATGNAIDTVTTDASGYYSFGPLQPGNYSVKEINKPGWTLSNPVNNMVPIVLNTHEVQQANFGNCPPPLCDSISFWVETLRTIPPECCFRLHIDNKAKNKFTQIPLNLFTASFNSITVDNINGWFTSQSGLSNIGLTHASGFIPVGSFTPISWCINGGSNPDTIKIKAEYLVGTSTTSCDTSFVFFCPPQPDTLCGRACQTDSISLNTGVDHSTGQFYNNGNPDPYWSIVQAPYSNLTFPIPAAVTYTNVMFWHDQPNGFQPCSKWITLGSFTYGHDPGIHAFQRCFCVCTDGAMIQIRLSVLVDNSANIILIDSTGTTITQLLSVPSTPGGAFHLPTRDTIVSVILDKGRYCIKANVYNQGSATGLNLCGSITGTGLGKDICCEPSAITGIKYIDTICTGSLYTGNLQTLQGWQIVLCNQQGVAIDTVTTDQNGSYIFSPLLPGLYTVKELNQPGWTPSLPATGMSSIFLDANQVAQVDFANCPPEIDSCCKNKNNFIQNVSNAIQLSKEDSLCKAKINVLRLPPCDSIILINWGDGQIVHGPFGTGMWMHTYTQSGIYVIQIPIVEFDSSGRPCFDTLIKFTIDIHCQCECGRYTMNMLQNGSLVQVHCNDTVSMSCPAPNPISVLGNFGCFGDSCSTPDIQWSLTGPSINLSGNISPGNFQINLPGPLNPGYSTLSLVTTCGMQVCSCKIILFQPSCALSDSCTTFCNGNSWNQLNTSWIQDMVVYQGRLIVAGSFNTIGNPAVAVNNIAAWNGTSWTPLTGGGLNSKVNDIEVHNGLLYAGGEFTMAGNSPANNIASWNGTSWSAIPQGGINGTNTNVDALLSSAWGLVVGGRFNSVGNSPLTANNIARWNPGPGWSAFAGGLNGPVFALSTFYGNIVVGGRFGNSPGGFNNIALWLGYWGKLGSGGAVNLNTTPPNSGDGIHALVQYKNDLIVAGQFQSAVSTTVLNGNKTQHLAQWNGAYWTTIGIGPNPPGSSINTGNGVYALKVINNELYVGGQFIQINNQNINLLAKWNGAAWTHINHPSTGIVRAIALYSPNKDSLCNLYTGGEVLFNQLKCSGVGIQDQSHSLSVTIYPNPSTGQVNIQFNEIIREEIEIGIYSLLGQRILHQVIPKINSAHPTHSIQINELSMGTYIIKVSTLKGSVVKKIIKG